MGVVGNGGVGAWLETSDVSGPAGHYNFEVERICKGKTSWETPQHVQNPVVLRMDRKIQDCSS